MKRGWNFHPFFIFQSLLSLKNLEKTSIGSLMLVRMISILFTLLILSGTIFAQKREFVSFKNGQVQFGQSYLDLDLKNFKLKFENDNKIIKAAFIKGTLEWKKSEEGLYLPQAELLIQIKQDDLKESQALIHFNDRVYSASLKSKQGKNYLSFSLTLRLFERNKLNFYLDGKKWNSLYLEALTSPKVKHHYIDPTCTPYHLEIFDFDEYLSVSCDLERMGTIGSERPKLKLIWVTPNYYTLDESKQYNVTTFTSSSSSSITLKNKKGELKKLGLKVKLPRKLNRIKTALGIGPYDLLSRGEKDGVINEDSGLTGNITLYGRFDITQNSSLRFFNSFAMKSRERFNNFGLYFAYDLARIYDDRIQIVALLGAQYITHQTEFSGHLNKLISPQGGEITFHHPFGLRNYVLGAGGFFSSGPENEYINSWIRFGKSTTYEINFIKYEQGNREVRVAGLSVIFPLFSFL